VFTPLVFTMFAVLLGIGIVTHPGRHPPLHLPVYAAFVLTVGHVVVRNWFHPPLPKGDLCAYLDTITYDGDSPRDVRKKIDTLHGQDET
jgi:hypothetical protein